MQVMVGLGLILMLSSVVAVAPVESETMREGVVEPALVRVPVRVPVAERLKPGGRLPGAALQV
jgi:hypothetical protein